MSEPYLWIDNVQAKNKVSITNTKPTGLMVIPGCEQTQDNPQGGTVIFQGAEYRNFSISPLGAIVLGGKGVYKQTLTENNIWPETTDPVIAPFAEWIQVNA